MELLKSLMIDVDGPTSETRGNLTSLSLDTSLTLHEELFKQALALNLARDSDSLVSRRDSCKKEATGDQASRRCGIPDRLRQELSGRT